jgi:rhodanese-related sulfurtransferase
MGLGAIALASLSALPSALMAEPAPSQVIAADAAYSLAQSGEIILIDIRTPEEWLQTGVAEGAIALDMRTQDFVPALVSLRKANPETPLALICRTGNRSEYVVRALADQGFPGLADVGEGMAGGPRGQGWIPRGLPIYEGTSANVEARLAAQMPG